MLKRLTCNRFQHLANICSFQVIWIITRVFLTHLDRNLKIPLEGDLLLSEICGLYKDLSDSNDNPNKWFKHTRTENIDIILKSKNWNRFRAPIISELMEIAWCWTGDRCTMGRGRWNSQASHPWHCAIPITGEIAKALKFFFSFINQSLKPKEALHPVNEQNKKIVELISSI